jgi:hypothetical protein
MLFWSCIIEYSTSIWTMSSLASRAAHTTKPWEAGSVLSSLIESILRFCKSTKSLPILLLTSLTRVQTTSTTATESAQSGKLLAWHPFSTCGENCAQSVCFANMFSPSQFRRRLVGLYARSTRFLPHRACLESKETHISRVACGVPCRHTRTVACTTVSRPDGYHANTDSSSSAVR